MSFDFSEFIDLRNKYARMETEWDKFLKQFLLDQGLRALTLTKDRTPWETGLLRAMWQLGDSKNVVKYNGNGSTSKRYFEDSRRSKSATVNSVTRNGDTLLIEIYNPVEYASYVEYGHFNRGRKSFKRGFHMANVAINKIEQGIPVEFEKQFMAWLRSLGVER